ncbi:MAG: preprotein translocase subunit SecG, partial [Chthoniobacteraceae bacterium]
MNWIGLTIKLLTGVDVLVCLLLILLVLLQRPKNEGLGAAFGGETASNLFGAQTTNVLATLTRWLGAIFMVLCLAIAVLGTFDKDRRGVVANYVEKAKVEKAERDKQKAAEEAAKAAAAAAEAAKRPQVPASATTPPVAVPPSIPEPGKSATPPAPPKDAPKPVESTPPQPAPASKPADSKPIGAEAPSTP